MSFVFVCLFCFSSIQLRQNFIMYPKIAWNSLQFRLALNSQKFSCLTFSSTRMAIPSHYTQHNVHAFITAPSPKIGVRRAGTVASTSCQPKGCPLKTDRTKVKSALHRPQGTHPSCQGCQGCIPLPSISGSQAQHVPTKSRTSHYRERHRVPLLFGGETSCTHVCTGSLLAAQA